MCALQPRGATWRVDWVLVQRSMLHNPFQLWLFDKSLSRHYTGRASIHAAAQAKGDVSLERRPQIKEQSWKAYSCQGCSPRSLLLLTPRIESPTSCLAASWLFGGFGGCSRFFGGLGRVSRFGVGGFWFTAQTGFQHLPGVDDVRVNDIVEGREVLPA